MHSMGEIDSETGKPKIIMAYKKTEADSTR